MSSLVSTPLSKQVRGKNWSSDECTTLVRRWIAVSEDPIKGTDQKGDDFWEVVAETVSDRNGLSCRKTWAKISQSVQKFSGSYSQIVAKKPSGHSAEDLVAKAVEL
jgi:hypothetical protein